MLPTDDEFDGMTPVELRHLSLVHWTPAAIAIQAARWLAPHPRARVLDVGAGVGKVCTIGALATSGTWFGIEAEASLAAAAAEIAFAFGAADRTSFLIGDALSIDWSEFDALYFYNPFEFPLFESDAPDVGRDHLGRVTARLCSLKTGTRVVTFHGYGDDMPEAYERRAHVDTGLGELALWVRR